MSPANWGVKFLDCFSSVLSTDACHEASFRKHKPQVVFFDVLGHKLGFSHLSAVAEYDNRNALVLAVRSEIESACAGAKDSGFDKVWSNPNSAHSHWDVFTAKSCR